jgi:hypothetical protein
MTGLRDGYSLTRAEIDARARNARVATEREPYVLVTEALPADGLRNPLATLWQRIAARVGFTTRPYFGPERRRSGV